MASYQLPGKYIDTEIVGQWQYTNYIGLTKSSIASSILFNSLSSLNLIDVMKPSSTSFKSSFISISSVLGKGVHLVGVHGVH